MYKHALSMTCVFPAGLAPGEQRGRNLVSITRDGNGSPVLRGTSLAGAVRGNYERLFGKDPVLFGTINSRDGDGGGTPSALAVPDSVLAMGASTRIRNHNRINRHSGTVADQAVFSFEACPPGTKVDLTLWLDDPGNGFHAEETLVRVASLFAGGFTVGGHGSRGVGWIELEGVPLRTIYDLGQAEEYGRYLDDHRQWRESGRMPGGDPLSCDVAEKDLSVRFELTIPRGQDFLVADGKGLEFEAEPQTCLDAEGRENWVLPGSTLRGLFRSWATHLAVREGEEVFDKAPNPGSGSLEGLSGRDYGYAGAKNAAEVICPVARLFGSLHAAGRVTIIDGVCRRQEGQDQVRKHVAVDRITGGAVEGALFDNKVLVSPPDSPVRFVIRMRVSDPEEHEARWMARALKALDLGLLRVGSSKAAGRLCLTGPPRVSGPHSKEFDIFNESGKEK